MTVILRDFKKQDVSEDELTILLSFVEEDIYDHQRQSTAFPLLKVNIIVSVWEPYHVRCWTIKPYNAVRHDFVWLLYAQFFRLGHLGTKVCE